MAALALPDAAAPDAQPQRLPFTPAQRKPDVLDKTVTFLAKRDGIDKVSGLPPSFWKTLPGACGVVSPNQPPWCNAGAEDYTLHVQAAAGNRAARLEQRGQHTAEGV